MKIPPWFILLIVAIVTVLAYLPGLFNGFVWLDHGEIENYTLLVKDIRDIPRIFLHDRNYEGYHRPVYNLLHSLDAALWGMNPFGFHLSSLFLHLLNVFLVSRVVSQYSSSMMTTWVITLLWSLHPVNSAVVGLIHAKADVFVVTMLCTAYLFADMNHKAQQPRLFRYYSSLFFFTIALFTKETAFLYPVFIAAECVFRWKQADSQRKRYLYTYLSSTLIVTLIVALIRIYPTLSGIYTSKCGLVERLLTFCSVYNDYLFKLFLPVNLSIDDTVTRFFSRSLMSQVGSLSMYCFFMGGQFVLFYMFKQLRRWILLYNLALLPVAQIIPILHFRADRFLYMASLALVATVVEYTSILMIYAQKQHIFEKRTLRDVVVALVILISLVFSGKIVGRIRDFKNDEELFRTEIDRNPDYKEGLLGLALYYDDVGKYSSAESFYRRCLDPTPHNISYVDSDTLILRYAQNLLKQRKVSKAYNFLKANESMLLNARSPSRYSYLLAEAAVKLELYEEAFPTLLLYRKAFPDDPDGHFLLGVCAYMLDKPDVAEHAFSTYLTLHPYGGHHLLVKTILEELHSSISRETLVGPKQ